jgi:ATP adenylyltransferase
MNRLWAPWRIKYVKTKGKKKCIFCESAKGRRSGAVVFKTRHSMVLLNIYPYNNGHLMVSPLRHVRAPEFLKDQELLDLMRALNKAKKLLQKVLKPQGFNIGINLERAGGAGITGHLHIHIVPRWTGDTNFMPVVSGTKVISQSLAELSKRLKDAQSGTD